MTAQDADVAILDASGAILTRETAQATLDKLAAHLGLADLRLDDDGLVELVVDDDTPLTLMHLDGPASLIVSTPFLELASVRGQLLRHLLQANMSAALTAGGTFGIVPGEATLRYSRHLVVADQDVERIDRELTAFVEHVAVWSDQIELYLDGLDDVEEPPAPEPSMPVGAPGQNFTGIKA